MNAPTLILPPRYSVDSIALYQAAALENWPVERLLGWRIPDGFDRTREFAVYGEALFGAVVADQLDLALIEPPFDFLTRIPEDFTRRRIRTMEFAAACGLDEKAFYKPADDKCFPAKVYASGAELRAFISLSEKTPVIVSEPVAWNAEFRFFVADGEIRTFSPYSRGGELIQNERGEWLAEPEEHERAFEFCRRLIAECPEAIPPAVVIDVGEIEDRGWAVVEANPCWASGIYGGDPAKILPVLKRACLGRNRITDADRRWLVERRD